jgi:xanthine dehydrogenase YagS FAD-binding subunit
MKNFEYAAPCSENEVLQLLSDQSGQTELLAGGTDLVGLMKKMIVTPDRVVNIMEVPTLKNIEAVDGGGIAIGATVTLDEVLAHPYLEDYPAITDAILGINSMQLQSQGTLGGEILQRPRCWFYRNGQELLDAGQISGGDNRFHAIFGNNGQSKFVQSSRIAPALCVLAAEARVIGPSDSDVQMIPLLDLFRAPRQEGQREHTLLPNQLVTHLVLPPVNGRLNATYEVRQGAGPEFPLASAAVSLELDNQQRVHQARVVLGQVAPTPWSSAAAAAALIGQPLDAQTAETAGLAAVEEATPLSHNGYKVQLAQVAVKRAILRAAGLEPGGL